MHWLNRRLVIITGVLKDLARIQAWPVIAYGLRFDFLAFFGSEMQLENLTYITPQLKMVIAKITNIMSMYFQHKQIDLVTLGCT